MKYPEKIRFNGAIKNTRTYTMSQHIDRFMPYFLCQEHMVMLLAEP